MVVAVVHQTSCPLGPSGVSPVLTRRRKSNASSTAVCQQNCCATLSSVATPPRELFSRKRAVTRLPPLQLAALHITSEGHTAVRQCAMQPTGRLSLEQVHVQLLVPRRLQRLVAPLAQPAMFGCIVHGAEQEGGAKRGHRRLVAESGVVEPRHVKRGIVCGHNDTCNARTYYLLLTTYHLLLTHAHLPAASAAATSEANSCSSSVGATPSRCNSAPEMPCA